MEHVDTARLTAELPNIQPVLDQLLALVREMNRTCIARGALVDAPTADALLPVIVRSNVLLDALLRLCDKPSPEGGERLAQLVDRQREWFERWRRASSN